MTNLTKTEIKETARKELLSAMAHAFYAIFEENNYDEETAQSISEEASRQMERIEKMFGYAPNSWNRG